MADTNELKRLNRKELLELLLIETHRNEELEEKLRIAEEKVMEREIALNESGSLAEAALRINGVMEAVDKAAAQYLENIKAKIDAGELSEITLPEIKIPEVVIPDPRTQVVTVDTARSQAISQEMINKTMDRCREIESNTRERCSTMVEKAREDAQAYWDEVYSRIKEYSGTVEALRENLAELVDLTLTEALDQ